MKRQCVRFLVVGVGNTALSFIAYRLLLAADTPYAIAALLLFAVGALNGLHELDWSADRTTIGGLLVGRVVVPEG